jgi:hypothetical protein
MTMPMSEADMLSEASSSEDQVPSPKVSLMEGDGQECECFCAK